MKSWCCTDNAFMPFSFARRPTAKGWQTFVGVPPSGGLVRPGFRLKAGLQPKATQQKPAEPRAIASQITTDFPYAHRFPYRFMSRDFLNDGGIIH